MKYAIIFLSITTLILLSRISYLKNELNKRNQAKQYYENKKMRETEAKNAATSTLYSTPSSFYTPKPSCMNANESLMYYYLNTALTSIISNPVTRKNYYIFPQVSLYSLVKLRPALDTITYDIAKSNYIAKSIDFVICYCHKVYNYYEYTPILLIELDGSSHHSSVPYGSASFSRQQANDAFKDSLFKDLNIPFCRFKINSHLTRSDLPEVYRMLRENLTIES